LPLEDEGTEGTQGNHLEKRVFGNEIMTASAKEGYKLSKFSLSILQDSGWYSYLYFVFNFRYVVDFSKAEQINWGKGKGCSFVTGKCGNNSFSDTDEFCTHKFLGCSGDSFWKTMCENSSFANGCTLRNLYTNCSLPSTKKLNFETHSPESQCHYYNNHNGRTAACIETICHPEKLEYKIIQKNEFSSFEHTCRYAGQEHSVAGGIASIICQDPLVICKKKYQCPKNCHGRGVCLDNYKCQCDFFYEGELCGKFKGCPSSNIDLCNALVNHNMVSKETLSNDFHSAYTEFVKYFDHFKGKCFNSRFCYRFFTDRRHAE
jgi:hypothetical protein